jgi:hypothetical protein
MQQSIAASKIIALSIAFTLCATAAANGLVASDLCTGDPCTITGNHATTDPFTLLDFGSAEVFLQGTIDIDSNSLDILAGGFTIAATGKILAVPAASFDSGGSVNVTTVGNIQLDSNNTGGAIVATGCDGGTVVLESQTGTISGTRGVTANRNTACLLSGEGGTIELIAATVDLVGALNAIGGFQAAGGIVEIDSSDVVRLGPVTVNGGESDGGTLFVSAGGAVTLGDVSANSVGNIGTGGVVSVVSTGSIDVLGNVEVLGGNGASEGGPGGDVSLVAGTPAVPADVLIGAKVRANGRGNSGSGGFIDIAGAHVTLDDQLSATGTIVISSAGVIDVFGSESIMVMANVIATTGGRGSITLQSDGDLHVLASVNAGGTPLGVDGGDVTLIAKGVLNLAGDVSANGGGSGTSGGSIFASGCELGVSAGTDLNASQDLGTVDLVAGQQMTIAGDVTAGPTLGTITLRHRSASQPPSIGGGTFNLVPTISVDPTIAPCAICTVTGDADSDGVDDSCDRCTLVPDPLQTDTDGDGFGNACDCDFDQTGQCGISDFNVFQADFQTSIDAGTGTDMDSSGVVGIGDFNLFLPGFTNAAPGPSAMAP